MIRSKFKSLDFVYNQVSNIFRSESNDFYGDNISPREVNDATDHQDRNEIDDGKNGYTDNSSEELKKVKENLSPSMINNDVENGSKRKEPLESVREKENRKYNKVNVISFYLEFVVKIKIRGIGIL